MATVREPRPGGDALRREDPRAAARKVASRVLADRAEGEAYVASVCFKHGPPRLTGVELEYIVHPVADPTRPVDLPSLARALRPHAPRTIDPDSPAEALPNGSTLTAEPGAQLEISTPPQESLPALAAATDADLAHLVELLASGGFGLSEHAIDTRRPPRRLLATERYAAMERRYAPLGNGGITWMCSTASLQVSLDVGQGAGVARRWAAAHALGPALLALFANSSRHACRETGHASARWLSYLGTDRARTGTGPPTADPAAAWARRVLDTPLMLVRRDMGPWDAPAGTSFADWISGRASIPHPPTTADLEYHLSTMFTPVRARGYLELRYLDAQPRRRWLDPVALLSALLECPETTEAALQACAPVVDRWESAARHGLADPAVARAARAVADLGCAELPRTGLPATTVDEITDNVRRRLHGIGVAE